MLSKPNEVTFAHWEHLEQLCFPAYISLKKPIQYEPAIERLFEISYKKI